MIRRGAILEKAFAGAMTEHPDVFEVDAESQEGNYALDRWFVSPLDFFARGKFNVPARAANASLADAVMIPGAKPWLFNGPNFIVQMKKFAASWSSTGWRNDRCFETTNRGDAISFGKACGSATHCSSRPCRQSSVRACSRDGMTRLAACARFAERAAQAPESR